MPNLIVLVVGLVFALVGYRKTWYPCWTYLFNLLIAAYVSIMITPQVVDAVPLIRNYLGNYSYAVFALTVAVVIFVVMSLFSFRFFTSASAVSFPKILDSVGAAMLGFFSGAVIAGFLLSVVSITPLSDYSFVRSVTQGRRADAGVNCAVLTSCNIVHDISLQPVPDAVEKQLELIMNGWNPSVRKPKVITAPPAAPPDSNTIEPSEVEADSNS